MKQAKDLLSNLKSLAGPLPDFHPNEITNNPSDLFLQWLNVAIDEGVREPHAMTLSTSKIIKFKWSIYDNTNYLHVLYT
ncbi:hypothetical protein [Virgibacillus salinus]|uniref:Pyridoxamine 5'-phosphate oxidase n=1 Tax=Virgibacillus salinus TaxID=553311 RepID=A0A1H1EU80_9BACI|nr:hypothetical protein [Virgibacillus salinus]SDQ92305.1 pyridoxamine 5'-phosphate oxidase [Virgibacillus salinus]